MCFPSAQTWLIKTKTKQSSILHHNHKYQLSTLSRNNNSFTKKNEELLNNYDLPHCRIGIIGICQQSVP
jgi:hypothetical protein